MKSLYIASALFFVSVALVAQVRNPQPSPAATVSAVIGVTDIKVEYSSPAVKGRKIWGDLVPYNEAWRAGANSPTKITFSDDVVIKSINVKAGSYSLFFTPKESGDWTAHIQEAGKSVFDYEKEGKIDMDALKKADIVAAPAKATAVADSQERLSFIITWNSNTEGEVAVRWEKIKVGFMVTTNTSALQQKSVEDAVKDAEGKWRTFMDAANFYAKTDSKKAMSYIDKSIALRGDHFQNQWVKAQLLAGDKKYDEALDMVKAAIQAGDAKPDGAYNFYKDQLKKHWDEWLPNASKEWKKKNKM